MVAFAEDTPSVSHTCGTGAPGVFRHSQVRLLCYRTGCLLANDQGDPSNGAVRNSLGAIQSGSQM